MTSWATTTNWPTDLLRVGDLTCISLAELLDLSARMKSEPDGRSGRGAARMRDYHADGAVMRLARPDAAFMHCLPARRGEEVEASVIDGRHAVVWEQVANRLPTEQAVIYALATADRAEAAHEEVA